MKILKSSLLLCVIVNALTAACSSTTSVVSPTGTFLAAPTVLSHATLTSTSEPANTPTNAPTHAPKPTNSATRINLSSKLYLDENSSPDNLRGEPSQGHHYFINSAGMGFVYQFENEEWVAARTESRILPFADFDVTPEPGTELRQSFVQVWRDGKMLYAFPVNGICCDPKRLLRYGDHWIFWFMDDWRNQGWIVQDGILLNDLHEYDNAFSAFLLAGKPFFLFRRGNQYGISFDDEEILLPYPNISYGPVCCEGGGKGHWNPRATDIMVGFYVQRGDSDYQYIEVGLR